MVIDRRRALTTVRKVVSDLKLLERSSGKFRSPNFKQKYVSLLSSHFGSWGIDPNLSSKLAEKIFKLHKKIVEKVDPFLRDNYGYDIFTYNYDVDLLQNALLRIYIDHDAGLLQDIAYDPGKANAYLSVLDAAAQAVQRNFALTDHIIREGYSLAPYAPYLRDYPLISQLIHRALRRRYPRLVTDLRHMMDIFFMSNNTFKYLDRVEESLNNFLHLQGNSSIPRQHITPYVVQVLPFALHASLVDVDPPRTSTRALLDVSRFLFGPRGKDYFPRLRTLAQHHELYPLLIGLAKHWNGNLNPRFWDAFEQVMKHGKHMVRELVNVDGQQTWGDLWQHLSKTAVHNVSDTEKGKTFISISKGNPIDQFRALCEQPTCLYPANEQGQQYGIEYVLNTKKGDVMPVIAVAHSVGKHHGGRDRIVGRLTMFVHPSAGNVYLVSTPVGSVDLQHYVDAAKRYADVVNSSAGKKVIQRVVVGGQGKYRFRIPVDDAYADMIERMDGVHYLRDAKVIHV